MRFTKMHGAGNDYVYVDCFAQPVPANPAELARRVSDRHVGIGGDGLILILPSPVADARMQMFNADGSESEMCGNGIRCVAKYVYDHGLVRKPTLAIQTKAGILSLDLEIAEGRVCRARVDMGEPILEPSRIPTTLPGNPALPGSPVVDAELEVAGRRLSVTCVSMGNPHCVTFVDRLTDDWVLGVGPQIEVDPHFPRRVNAEFVEIVSPTEVRVRVWERGSGETQACGTGASAVCVAASLAGRTQRKILAHLPGGDLELDWADNNHVYLTGPAVEVFSGEWEKGEGMRDEG
jgi:diaminopimelate epimerase